VTFHGGSIEAESDELPAMKESAETEQHPATRQ
jgi:hypothetical protein